MQFIMHPPPPILLLPPPVRCKINFGAPFLYNYIYIHPLEKDFKFHSHTRGSKIAVEYIWIFRSTRQLFLHMTVECLRQPTVVSHALLTRETKALEMLNVLYILIKSTQVHNLFFQTLNVNVQKLKACYYT
jgi:hypothetical protein